MRRALGIALAVVAVIGPQVPVRGAVTARHCVVRLEPIGPATADSVVQARAVELGCYATLAEAIAVATDGAVHLPSSTAPAHLTDGLIARYSEDAVDSVVIGTEYQGTGYSGGSTNYTASSSCSVSQSWEVSWVGAALNDSFSSGKGFGGCDSNRKFEDADFGGGSRLCAPNCSNYGTLSNEVSSLRWEH
jgi:hypothetical protein